MNTQEQCKEIFTKCQNLACEFFGNNIYSFDILINEYVKKEPMVSYYPSEKNPTIFIDFYTKAYDLILNLKTKYENFFNKLGDPIPVYRALSFSSNYNTYEDAMNNIKEISSFGESWSYNPEKAIPYKGFGYQDSLAPFGRPMSSSVMPIIICGLISKDNIDWGKTNLTNFKYNFAEEEIRVKKGKQIEVVGVFCRTWEEPFHEMNFVVKASYINWTKISSLADII